MVIPKQVVFRLFAKKTRKIILLSSRNFFHGNCWDDKSNEITAIPKLMDILDLKGTIITTDALNTQKSIADKAIEKGGDYLLPVKGNQPGLQESVIAAFEVVEQQRASAIVLHERAIAKAKEYCKGTLGSGEQSALAFGCNISTRSISLSKSNRST